MNAGAAKVVVENFVKGYFDVLDALSPKPFVFDILDIADATTEQLAGHVERLPLVLRAKVAGGGAVAMMFRASEAAVFAALGSGSSPDAPPELDEAGMRGLSEVAEAALGGGISAIGTAYELDMAVEGAEAVESPAELFEYMQETCTGGKFHFALPGAIDAEGMLVYTQNLEDMCPAKLLNASTGNAQLSEQEMSDILSGFEVAERAEDTSHHAAEAPPNLDMILDINLVVTARLGRVELPIQEILSLGPGSIIEVGHLVDEPVELLVNNKLIARGDVVVVDEKFGLRITEIVSTRERIQSLR